MAYHSVFAPRLCAGQTVLVTGGGSGIGRCTARELAALGASVALVGREAEKLAAVQQEIEAADGRCSTQRVDIWPHRAVRRLPRRLDAARAERWRRAGD